MVIIKVRIYNKEVINPLNVCVFLMLFTLSFLAKGATTDAVAEDIPFGRSETYLKRSLYKTFLSIFNSEYKYIMDIPKNHDIIVAVIDDYMSSDHESLENQFWINTAEGDGVHWTDDDNNGYEDDIHGWDFDGNQPYDNTKGGRPHGNQVAGIIMGNFIIYNYAGYQLPIRGVNTDVKVMRIYQGDTVLTPDKEAEAIRYAVDNGAKVINLSHHAFDTFDNILLNAVTYAKTKGVFIVAGGPNSGSTDMSNIDHFEDVFAVARMTYVSGIGQDNGDIYHLTGVWHDKIDYCLPQNMKAISSQAGNIGTSFATPLLSGIIARILMHDNTVTHDQMRQILDNHSIVSTVTNSDGTMYTCRRPSGELLFKNYYGGSIERKSVRVKNHDGKQAIFNIETLLSSSGELIRREIRHINSGKNRYWVNKEIR